MKMLLDNLKRNHHLEHSVLILTSDHGEAFFEHPLQPLQMRGSEHGYSLFYHQTNVPLLIRLPNGIRAGSTVDLPVTLLDLAPTLANLGGTSANDVSGRSLTRLLQGSSLPETARFISAVKHRPELQAVEERNFKLIHDRRGGSLALFNLEADPTESSDTAADHPQILSELKAELAAHLKLAQDAPQAGSAPLNDQAVENLKSLGYLE